MADMKIAHVIRSLDPSAGGPPLVAARLATAQACLGHDVKIIAYTIPHAAEHIIQMIGTAPGAEKLERDELPPPTRLELLSARTARRELINRLSGIDILHFHGVWDPLLKATADIARKRGIPYIVAPHGMLDPWSLSQRRLKKQVALALGYRAMLNDAAFLHLLNRDEADLLRPLKLTAQSEIIPNGVSPQDLAHLPARGEFRSAHPELGTSPFILFLSRLHYKKGLDYLADAFKALVTKHSDVRLVVAGPDDGARSAFEDQIPPGLKTRVHVIGPIFGHEKYAAFRDAACFCLPSRQEGFSMAILEAMACGTPVVISTHCHFPEVTGAGAGEVVPLETPAITEALSRVLSDTAARDRMGTAGQAMVHDHYTWPRIAQQTIVAYERALNR